ncbi:hypothetical protein BDV29DRAFT_161247 [Aspergillus leporis]|uniref:CHCH domain-containing protein n=1 Tax=Aspergillus leporis TaxID=41062 RepID=A0A5N5WM45_9EURO|nr:hypothetical protein BDV29DRAFT_161247 [Aspergillus leporis]
MSPKEQNPQVVVEVGDDEPDEWDKRIFSTGCSVEQDKMNDCYFAKKDWRACKKEVSESFGFPRMGVLASQQLNSPPMEVFRECWKRNGNDQRTQTKDA